MKLSPKAAPGVEQYAETAVESACQLADLTGPESWNAAVADDAWTRSTLSPSRCLCWGRRWRRISPR